MKYQLFNRQQGDTIVEVLIAIAITSLVLTTAYALANRNVATLQDTQEHAEALKLVQSQTEYLRLKGAPTASCFAGDGTSTDNCTFNSDGTYNPNGRYTLQVYKDSNHIECAADAYTVNATWDSLLNLTDSVTVCYRPADGA